MVMMSGLETSRSKNSKNDLTEIKKALLTGNAFFVKAGKVYFTSDKI